MEEPISLKHRVSTNTVVPAAELEEVLVEQVHTEWTIIRIVRVNREALVPVEVELVRNQDCLFLQVELEIISSLEETVQEEATISNFHLFNKTRHSEQWWAEEIKDHLELEDLEVENQVSPVLIDSLEAVR